jgi:hypothetical protein
VKASLAVIAGMLNTSVTQLRAIVDDAYRRGDTSVAFEKVDGVTLYPYEAVCAAVAAARDAKLSAVEITDAGASAVAAVTKKSREIDAYKARNAQRKIEGQNRKANRRAAKAAR